MTGSSINSESSTLSPLTSGFVLSAALTVIVNTGLAWAKDAYPPLNAGMKSLSGHHWTTHGLIDLLLFVCLGFLFAKTSLVRNIGPNRLNATLIGAVTVAGLGLGLWYAFF